VRSGCGVTSEGGEALGAGTLDSDGASRAPAAGAVRPALADENMLQPRIGPRARNALRRCFVREEQAFLIPFCRPLWKTQKDDGCTCSGSALVPGRTGARDRYGHALTGWEAASRRYAATAGQAAVNRRGCSAGSTVGPCARVLFIDLFVYRDCSGYLRMRFQSAIRGSRPCRRIGAWRQDSHGRPSQFPSLRLWSGSRVSLSTPVTACAGGTVPLPKRSVARNRTAGRCVAALFHAAARSDPR